MTLTPEERRRLALDLCARMVDEYPDQVLIGGLYGSTARGTDTPWSDLEMLFVVVEGCPARGQHLLFRGTAAGYRVYRPSELEAIVRTPGTRWPFHMGMLHSLEVLTGDPALVEGWLALGAALPRGAFLRALAQEVPGLVFEAHGRIHSSLARGEPADVFPAALELLFEMRTALCLLNQAWVHHDYGQGLADTFAFSKLPAGYVEGASALYRAREAEAAPALADGLVAAFLDLLQAEGVAVRDYAMVAEIPV